MSAYQAVQQRVFPSLPANLSVAERSFFRFKEEHGLYSGPELAERVRQLPQQASSALVEGFLEPCSVNVLTGDSGIGKSALVYQLALAVSTGKPFLGQACRASKVILGDY